MVFQQTLHFDVAARTFRMITAEIAQCVRESEIKQGLCTVFIRHTSASVLITENADSAVRRDLEKFMRRVAPDGSPDYEHDTEGPDDMPAHIRNMLTASSVSIPVMDGHLGLGTWQGIYVWEHRAHRHSREVIVTVVGDK
jgi:secondary thiamine-phosphate synthase enzyme